MAFACSTFPLPNGSSLKSEKYPYKLAWLGCLNRYLDAQEQREPLCMVGDFNIGLEARDLPDPDRQTGGIMASDAERQAFVTPSVNGFRTCSACSNRISVTGAGGITGRSLGSGPRLAHRPHLSM